MHVGSLSRMTMAWPDMQTSLFAMESSPVPHHKMWVLTDWQMKRGENAIQQRVKWCRGLADEASSSSSEDEDIAVASDEDVDVAAEEWGVGAMAANPNEAVPLVCPEPLPLLCCTQSHSLLTCRKPRVCCGFTKACAGFSGFLPAFAFLLNFGGCPWADRLSDDLLCQANSKASPSNRHGGAQTDSHSMTFICTAG